MRWLNKPFPRETAVRRSAQRGGWVLMSSQEALTVMKPTKEQREFLAGQLSHPYGSVDLMCDGYRVSLRVERYKSLSYRVVTYVNGVWKGEWISGTNSHPEQKFLRKSVRPTVSPAERAKLEKALGKRYVKKDPYWSGSITLYCIDWGSGRAAISHLCKVCESIEILEQPL